MSKLKYIKNIIILYYAKQFAWRAKKHPNGFKKLERLHQLGKRRFVGLVVLIGSIWMGLGNLYSFRHAPAFDLVLNVIVSMVLSGLLDYYLLGPIAWNVLEELCEKQKALMAGLEDEGARSE